MRGAIVLCALAALAAASGCGRRTVLVTGRTLASDDGRALASVALVPRARPLDTSRSSPDGYFVLRGVRVGDTIDVRGAGFERTCFAVEPGPTETDRALRDVYLDPIPDTAYTAAGPVDASIFLDNPRLRMKKLSPNEARQIVREKFPGIAVRNGTLITVDGKEEWYFELHMGHALVGVYLNALTGKIRSIESEDPNLDRRLQDLLDDDP